MTTKPNQDGAIALAMKMVTHLEDYENKHGASSTVLDGLWALAFMAAYLLCSRGVDTEIARRGFLHALDHAINTAPPDHGDQECTPNSSPFPDTRH